MDPSNICDFNDLLGVFRQAFTFQEIIDLSSVAVPKTAWYPAGQPSWMVEFGEFGESPGFCSFFS